MSAEAPPINKLNFTDLVRCDQLLGREPLQGSWHAWIAPWVAGKTVLDVGSGVSTIKEDLLHAGAAAVTTQEPCAWCNRDISAPVDWIGGCYDVVTCLDVIEHVVDYGRFAMHLARLTRQHLFITTPGVLFTGNANPFHYHEFRCNEVVQLFEASGLQLVGIRTWLEMRDQLDVDGEAARLLAASEPRVHPMGFHFVR